MIYLIIGNAATGWSLGVVLRHFTGRLSWFWLALFVTGTWALCLLGSAYAVTQLHGLPLGSSGTRLLGGSIWSALFGSSLGAYELRKMRKQENFDDDTLERGALDNGNGGARVIQTSVKSHKASHEYSSAMPNYKRSLAFACVIGVVVLGAIYVWPTRYFYVELDSGGFDTLVRVDRFTGEAYRLSTRGPEAFEWKRVEEDLDRLIEKMDNE